MSNNNTSEPRIWSAKMTNTKEEPWLDMFVCGHVPKPKGGLVSYKTKEGRIYKGKWREMQPGEYLKVTEVVGKKIALFRIVAIHLAPDFKTLVMEHRKELAPHLKTEKDIVLAYQHIVDTIPDGELLVKENGVVAIELKLQEYHGFGF